MEMDLSSGGEGAPELQASGQETSQPQQEQEQGNQQQQATGQDGEQGAKSTADGDGDISLDDVKAPEENASVTETANKDQQQA